VFSRRGTPYRYLWRSGEKKLKGKKRGGKRRRGWGKVEPRSKARILQKLGGFEKDFRRHYGWLLHRKGGLASMGVGLNSLKKQRGRA